MLLLVFGYKLILIVDDTELDSNFKTAEDQESLYTNLWLDRIPNMSSVCGRHIFAKRDHIVIENVAKGKPPGKY